MEFDEGKELAEGLGQTNYEKNPSQTSSGKGNTTSGIRIPPNKMSNCRQKQMK